MRVHRVTYAWIAAVLLWIGIAAPSANADAIYQYTGNLFTLCGYGCPGNKQPENAPADWASDYIIASISFAAPLAPNLTFSDDVLSLLTAWSMKDALGYFSLSSAAGDVLNGFIDDDGALPPLVLSTDANGNIVNFIMGATPDDGTYGPQTLISNPPLDCPQCNPAIVIAESLGFLGNDDVGWEAVSQVPGKWAKVNAVPEPSTLLLTSLSGVILILAKRWKQ